MSMLVRFKGCRTSALKAAYIRRDYLALEAAQQGERRQAANQRLHANSWRIQGCPFIN